MVWQPELGFIFQESKYQCMKLEVDLGGGSHQPLQSQVPKQHKENPKASLSFHVALFSGAFPVQMRTNGHVKVGQPFCPLAIDLALVYKILVGH